MELQFPTFQEKDQEWAKIINSKYFKNSSPLLSPPSSSVPSIVARSIRNGWPLFHKGIRFVIARGRETRLWSDLRSPISGPLLQPETIATVSSIIDQSNSSWDLSSLSFHLPPEAVETIQSIPISFLHNATDSFSWEKIKNGMFSSKSAYQMQLPHHPLLLPRFGNLTFLQRSASLSGFVALINFPQNQTFSKEKSFQIACATPASQWKTHATSSWIALDQQSCGVILASIQHLSTTLLISLLGSKITSNKTLISMAFHHIFSSSLVATLFGDGGTFDFLNQGDLSNLPPISCHQHLNSSFSDHKSMDRKCNSMLKFLGLHLLPGSLNSILMEPLKESYVMLGQGDFRDHNGALIMGYARKIRTSSSLEAELWGLRDGLAIAIDMNYLSLSVEIDASALIHLLDMDTTNHPLNALLIDCRCLLARPHVGAIRNVFREGNKAVDAMASLGCHLSFQLSRFFLPPTGVDICISNDVNGVGSIRLCNLNSSS